MNHNHAEDKCATCCNCDHSGPRRHLFLRIILGVIILLFVFWGGFKLGELKVLIGLGFYGYNSYNSGYNMMNPRNNNWNYGMMNWQYR
ncbi:hypothetical protein HZB06_01015 [Candidatus Wolfebacteria bacterium]|nr:hypothetical protein [Candidatus Wolfebacteria bacterium]